MEAVAVTGGIEETQLEGRSGTRSDVNDDADDIKDPLCDSSKSPNFRLSISHQE